MFKAAGRRADGEGRSTKAIGRRCRVARAGLSAAPGPRARASAIIGSRAGRTRAAREVDLILRERDGTLVFVEVRARADASHGGALASVDAAKQRRLVRAAQHYLLRLAGAAALPLRRGGDRGRSKCSWLQAAFDAADLGRRSGRGEDAARTGCRRKACHMIHDHARTAHPAAVLRQRRPAVPGRREPGPADRRCGQARGRLHHRRRQGAGLRAGRRGRAAQHFCAAVHRPLRARAAGPGRAGAGRRHGAARRAGHARRARPGLRQAGAGAGRSPATCCC